MHRHTVPLLKHLTCDPKTTLIVQVPKTIVLSEFNMTNSEAAENIRGARGENCEGGGGGNTGRWSYFD